MYTALQTNRRPMKISFIIPYNAYKLDGWYTILGSNFCNILEESTKLKVYLLCFTYIGFEGRFQRHKKG